MSVASGQFVRLLRLLACSELNGCIYYMPQGVYSLYLSDLMRLLATIMVLVTYPVIHSPSAPAMVRNFTTYMRKSLDV